MTPAEVQAATLREVSVVIAGAQWRQEQAARLSVREAWVTAALMRQEKLPRLETLIGEAETTRGATPEQIRASLLDWAKATGLKVERHAVPVIDYARLRDV